MPVIGGLIKNVAAQDAALAKRAPQARKLDPALETRVKANMIGLRYDGGRSNDPKQLPVSPLYDYEAVRALLDIESLFSKTCWKYVEQIWSRGWEFVSKNKKTADYIKTRFKQISYVSDVTTHELFTDIAIQAVVYSNVYIQKLRKRDSSGGQVRKVGAKTVNPVAAYVVLDAPSIKTVRNPYGKPLKYIQELKGKLAINGGGSIYFSPDGYNYTSPYQEISPEDMIHITFHRQAGFSEGTPMVIPVMDDIAALRRLEETAEIIAFQASIPIYHFIAGTKELTGSPAEVDDLESKVNNMLAHGSLVTNERCTIEIKQADSEITSILEFISYYRQRVLSGLGVSPVLMGESGTSNRDTSLVIANEMQQTTRLLQKTIAETINSCMINELLLEGGVDIFDDYHTVKLYIPEIDAASERANQVHGLMLYEGGGITESDLRRSYLGRDPLEDDERGDMFLARVTVPTIEAKGHATALGGGADGPNGAAALNKVRSITAPQNQHGKFSRPSRAAKRDDHEEIINETSNGTTMEHWLEVIKRRLPEIDIAPLLPKLHACEVLLRVAESTATKEMAYNDVHDIVLSTIYNQQ